MAESYKEKIKAGWIHCNVMIEILGKPKEYIDEILRELVKKMKLEKPIEIIKEKYSEPREHEEEKYFTQFMELELVIQNMKALQEFIFAYMPSSIEIIGPTEIKMSLNDANYLMNDLSARLHSYDDITKKLKAANMIITQKLRQFIPNLSQKDFEDVVPSKEEKKDKK